MAILGGILNFPVNSENHAKPSVKWPTLRCPQIYVEQACELIFFANVQKNAKFKKKS